MDEGNTPPECRWVEAQDYLGNTFFINPRNVWFVKSVDSFPAEPSSKVYFSDHTTLKIEMTPEQFTDCAGISVYVPKTEGK